MKITVSKDVYEAIISIWIALTVVLGIMVYRTGDENHAVKVKYDAKTKEVRSLEHQVKLLKLDVLSEKSNTVTCMKNMQYFITK